MIVVHNPTNAPVTDYPIQEPNSKEVNLWSINPGETLEFPDYVGKYLLEVYEFLQEVMTEDQLKEREEEKKKLENNQNFTRTKIIKPASGEPTEKVKEHEGLTTQVAAGTVAKKFVCPEEGCGQEFTQDAHRKVHYASKHLVLPE